jgi:uncharacterized protein (DUF433 family)
MSAPVEIGSLITRSPEIRSGRPHITGTGMTVMRIAGYYQLGMSAEEIRDQIDHLSLAQVYAALAYYHANRAEIESDLDALQPFYERLARAPETFTTA